MNDKTAKKAALISMSMIMLVTGCGKSKKQEAPAPTPTIEVMEESKNEPSPIPETICVEDEEHQKELEEEGKLTPAPEDTSKPDKVYEDGEKVDLSTLEGTPTPEPTTVPTSEEALQEQHKQKAQEIWDANHTPEQNKLREEMKKKRGDLPFNPKGQEFEHTEYKTGKDGDQYPVANSGVGEIINIDIVFIPEGTVWRVDNDLHGYSWYKEVTVEEAEKNPQNGDCKNVDGLFYMYDRVDKSWGRGTPIEEAVCDPLNYATIVEIKESDDPVKHYGHM